MEISIRLIESERERARKGRIERKMIGNRTNAKKKCWLVKLKQKHQQRIK